jgi:hypothetical protein
VLNPRNNECGSYIESEEATPPLGRQRWGDFDESRERWASCELELTEERQVDR